MISETEYDIIQKTWTKAITMSDSLGTIFYKKLFAKHPHFEPLFAIGKGKQEKKLTFVLGTIFTKLNKIEDIENEIRSLAKRHIQYQVKTDDFELFGDVLIDTMALVLDDAWQEEYDTVWKKIYKIVSEAMIKEMKAE